MLSLSIPTIILHHKEYILLETEPFQEFLQVETLLKDYDATPILAFKKFFRHRHISPHTLHQCQPMPVCYS